MSRPSRLVASCAAVAALALTACSQTSGSGSVATPNLTGALLSASEVGAGFTGVASQPTRPLPCTPGAAPVDRQLHHSASARVSFDDRAGTTEVAEQVYVYAADSDAKRHQQLDEAGLHCKRGILGGTSVDLAGPYDIRTELAIPQVSAAEAWPVSNADVTAELYLVRLDGIVVQFTFAVSASVHPSVDVEKVIRTALRKVVAHT